MKYNSVVDFVYLDVEAFEVISLAGPTYFNITQSKVDSDKTVRFFI